MTDKQQWFIKTSTGKSGPFQFEELQYFADRQKIKPNTAVGNGDSTWVKAKRVDGLYFPSEPPAGNGHEEQPVMPESSFENLESKSSPFGMMSDAMDSPFESSDIDAKAASEPVSQKQVAAPTVDERIDDTRQREIDLAAREGDLAIRESKFAGREAKLARRESEFAAREEEFAEREAALGKREDKCDALEMEVRSRESDLGCRDADLELRETEVKHRESELRRREANFLAKETEAAERAQGESKSGNDSLEAESSIDI